MLELPGARVRNEYGVEPSGKRRVDVAARAVADHPTVRLHHAVPLNDAKIGGDVLLLHDLNHLEKRLEAGALDLGGLFGRLALGAQNQPVAFGQISQSLRHTFENARGNALELFGAGADLVQRLLARHVSGQLQVGLLEGAAKAADAVAVLPDHALLGLVQNAADVFGREAEGLEQLDVSVDGLLEEDVILPERIVGVDQESFAAHEKMNSRPCGVFCRAPGHTRFAGRASPSTPTISSAGWRQAFRGCSAPPSASRQSGPGSPETRDSLQAPKAGRARCAESCRAAAPDGATALLRSAPRELPGPHIYPWWPLVDCSGESPQAGAEAFRRRWAGTRSDRSGRRCLCDRYVPPPAPRCRNTGCTRRRPW